MANAQNGPLSLPAAADLSGSIYCGAKLGSTGLVLPSAGEAIFGVLQNKAASGKTALIECRPGHRSIAIAGGTVTRGERLKCDAAGKFVTASAQDIADGKAVAICVEGGSANMRISLILTGGNPMAALTASESISTAAGGAVASSAFTADTLVTVVTSSATGVLANGLFVGQKKTIRVISVTGAFNYALTPTTMAAGQPASFTFTAKGQKVVLNWTATGWEVIDGCSAGAAAVAAAGTVNILHRITTLVLGGASEDRILPSGWWVGQRHTFMVTSDAGDTTISGLFYDEDGSADGIDLQIADAGDIATVEWDGARWLPIQLVSVTVA